MVDIFFDYKGKIITLPINPEELKIDVPGNNENTEVLGLGEINILKKPRLCPISISSFFPEDKDPQQYIDFFKKIQQNAEPMRIVCLAFNLNMQVGIDGFGYAMRAGEEGDRYYTLELQEWVNYAPRTIKETAPVVTTREPEKTEPKQERPEEPPAPPATYTVKSGDSLWAIAKKYTGDGTRYAELYELNKGIIGANPSLIYPSQTYTIPAGW